MITRRVITTLVLLGAILIGAAAYFASRPDSPVGTFPARLSDSEIAEIEAAIRMERYARSFRYLRARDFTEAYRWLYRSRGQRVWDVGEQADGGIWLHVGTDRESAQKSMTGQFIMSRREGKWVITASNF